MKQFLDDNFLLSNQIAEELYHDHAKNLPIIDYHNHLDPQAISANGNFSNITEGWLYGDHYKWRAMRANGVSEKYITGAASDVEKFQKWGETVPYTLRNPLYHWTHLELRRYFGISDLLNAENASAIFENTSSQLQESSHSIVGLLRQMNVELLCTTDDPVDDLRFHKETKSKGIRPSVFPTFRPDKALDFGNLREIKDYFEKLSVVSSVQIGNLDTLLEALQSRVNYFHANGCRISDLGFNKLPMIRKGELNLEGSMTKVLKGSSLDDYEVEDLQGFVLTELCKMYHAKGWAQQFHLGALRNNNARALRELGPDTGFDSIGDFEHGVRLSEFFNNLDNTDQLAKSIVYNLNPRDNDLFATMVGNFNDGEIIGKMQFGTGWWFLDQKNGMENQMNSLSNMGLFSRFIGMLTDSRSFLSFPRHEYFRRIMCNLIGSDVINGELPNDLDLLSDLVKNISYYNAKNYFDFE